MRCAWQPWQPWIEPGPGRGVIEHAGLDASVDASVTMLLVVSTSCRTTAARWTEMAVYHRPSSPIMAWDMQRTAPRASTELSAPLGAGDSEHRNSESAGSILGRAPGLAGDAGEAAIPKLPCCHGPCHRPLAGDSLGLSSAWLPAGTLAGAAGSAAQAPGPTGRKSSGGRFRVDAKLSTGTCAWRQLHMRIMTCSRASTEVPSLVLLAHLMCTHSPSYSAWSDS